MIQNKFFKPVDISTIVLFRIIFGVMMLVDVIRYLKNDWITQYWILPKHNIPYWPLDFVKPLPGDGMYYLFYLMFVLAICIIVGLFYRLTTFLFFICFTYSFLIEQTKHLNHFYLITLISFLMICIPANKSLSFDNLIFKRKNKEWTPAWSLWIIRFMIAVPYFFGGIAKLNYDWLHGEPVRAWLRERDNIPFFGKFFREEWFVYSFTYSGLIIDLLVVPLLVIRKTRVFAFIVITLFHLINSKLFGIGIFPWFMLFGTTLFFEPDWPRRLVNYFSKTRPIWPATNTLQENISPRKKQIIVGFFCFWVTFHCLFPLRHFLIPGDVSWTEDGHKFSWHMKLRSKSSDASFTIVDNATGEEKEVNPENYLEKWQAGSVGKNPSMILYLCKIIKEDYKQRGFDVAVYADVKVSLNGRPYQRLVKPDVDLSKEKNHFLAPYTWVFPLTTPLKKE